MAKKKVLKTTKTSKKEAKSLSFAASRKELLSSPSSYRSLFFGVATVIILFLIGFGITRLFLGNPTPEIDNGAVSTENIENALNNRGDYTVKEGDTLWSIAEEKYGSGFEWYRIADANGIKDSANLEKGTALVIPDMNKEVPSQEVSNAATPTAMITVVPTTVAPTGVIEKMPEAQVPVVQGEKITGNSYVIKSGDDLWDIAVRAYGDGYKWVEIASANKLENPDLIHSDNKLVIPR